MSDQIVESISNAFPSQIQEIQILVGLILLFGGIIGMFWQIISYFWQRKLRETWDSKTVLVRKIIKFYYLGFLVSFTCHITISIFLSTFLSIFNFQRPDFLLSLEIIFAQI